MGKKAWEQYDETHLAKLEMLAKQYRQFLDTGKTERECAREEVRQAEAAGYVNLQDVVDGKVPMRNDMSIIYIKIRPFPHRHNTLSARPYDKRSKVQALNIIVPIKSKEYSHNHTHTY